MGNIKVLKVYNLINSKGAKLWLRLGIMQGNMNAICVSGDKGYRWSFEGDDIPMPVRSRTWFNGFPEGIMLDWLKANDWYIQACVDMGCGRAKVYEVPKVDKHASEMEMLGTDKFPALSEMDKPVFERIIRNLVSDGHKAAACRVYRYAHGGTISNALKAVNFICTE